MRNVFGNIPNIPDELIDNFVANMRVKLAKKNFNYEINNNEVTGNGFREASDLKDLVIPSEL